MPQRGASVPRYVVPMSHTSDVPGVSGPADAPGAPETSGLRRRRRRAIVIALIPFTVFVVAIAAVVAWYLDDPSEPVPTYVAGSGVEFATNGPIPGSPVGGTDVVLWLSGVGDGQARIKLDHYESNTEEMWTVKVGDTVNFRGLSVTVCAIWENEKRLAPWDEMAPGDNSFSDRLYYVASTEDPIPVCPAQVS